jgi:hypothetical protein
VMLAAIVSAIFRRSSAPSLSDLATVSFTECSPQARVWKR